MVGGHLLGFEFRTVCRVGVMRGSAMETLCLALPSAAHTHLSLALLAHRHSPLPQKGLCLHQVYYPPQVDDPATLLYPSLAHDEYGRLDWAHINAAAAKAELGLESGDD